MYIQSYPLSSSYPLPSRCVHKSLLYVYVSVLAVNLYRFSRLHAAAAAKSFQSCPTLCDPIDSSPPGSPVPGILQARTLEWVAISFSNAWKWKVKVKSLGRVRLLATPWTAAYQAPPSMGFSRQKYWSGVPLPSPVNAYGAHIICISCSKLELKWIDKSTCKIEWSMFFYSNVTGFQILCIILWNIWVIMLIGTTGEY